MENAMEIREYIAKIFQTNHGVIKRLLDDVSEETSLERFGHEINHIRWQAGHIAGSATLMLSLMDENYDLPENWPVLIGRGEKFEPDPQAWPSLAEIKNHLYKIHGRLENRISLVELEKLETERQILPEWNTSPAQAILFLCDHEFYHAGQIMLLRRMAGLPNVIG